MNIQHFTATITKFGDRTIISIPFDPNDVWSTKQRHYITGTVNGQKVRGPLESDGAHTFISLGAAWRRDCGLDVGAKVDVVLSPEGPQTESLSPDIDEALAADPQAKAFFDGLATFYRKNYIRWIEGSKRPETRRTRITEMVQLLKDGKKQK
jgi:hypothetical protein